MELKGKKIAVLGLGEENKALVRYLSKKGIKVTICDQKSRRELEPALKELENCNFELVTGEGYLDKIKNFDIIFRTPGLPYLTSQIQKAKAAGAQISSVIKLFFQMCPSPILGVTGTKGKGTTTTLIGDILKASGKEVYVGGNIGNAPIEFLDQVRPSDIVVLELSSFQLQDLDKSPHIAVVLDIKVDHLDYHSGRNEYIEAKKSIVYHQNKKDFAVINADYLTSFEFASSTEAQVFFFSRRKSVDLGAFVLDGKVYLRNENGEKEIIDISEIKLRGEHNLENICAAVIASYLAGANIEAIKKTVRDFKGLEHRLELVGEKNGIKFYNDSFSTTPDTTIAALRSFAEPIILLLGGSEKNADYQDLGKEISNSTVKEIIPIGLTAERIIKEIDNNKINFVSGIKSLGEAFELIKNTARSGDVVLLSPASASFDRFKNYKERGRIFKEQVESF